MNHEAIPIRAEAQTPGADFCLEARYLKVAGITPFTSIDFPGKLAAVAFLQGCPWQCIYCQNPWMQSRAFAPDLEHSSWEELEKLLSRRKGLLDGVVFSGGEPLTDPALKSAIEEVKSLGMAVGLHTSGSYPRHLKEVIGLVDWVGLDVKAPSENAALFEAVTKRKGSAAAFRESFEVVRASGVSYEARTTAHPDFLSAEAIGEIADWLAERGCKTYALQIFRPAPHIDLKLAKVGSDYPGEELLARLKAQFEHFTLRRG